MVDITRGTKASSIGIVLTAIAFATLLARLYTRYVLMKNAGSEEIFICLAWLFSLGLIICVGFENRYGLGHHLSTLPYEIQTHYLLSFFVAFFVYSLAIFLTKVSILLLYLRLFPNKTFVRCCWATIIIMVAFLQWTIFGFMFTCKPVDHFWNRAHAGNCTKSSVDFFINPSFNIVTDFVLFGLPLPILRSLQLPRKQKVDLLLLFSLGLVGCLTSIIRLRSLYVVSISNDLTYDGVDICIWSAVELNVGICCACGSTLKPLINAVVPRLRSNDGSGRVISTSIAMRPAAPGAWAKHPSQRHQSYSQFDVDCEIQSLEPGKVRVTTNIEQDIR